MYIADADRIRKPPSESDVRMSVQSMVPCPVWACCPDFWKFLCPESWCLLEVMRPAKEEALLALKSSLGGRGNARSQHSGNRVPVYEGEEFGRAHARNAS